MSSMKYEKAEKWLHAWVLYFLLSVVGVFCVERFFSMLTVIRLIIDVIHSISASSVFSFMISKMESISSMMCFRRLSQYSKRILVSVRPKFKIASSHLSCKAELTIGTCCVKLILRDLGIDFNQSHFFK